MNEETTYKMGFLLLSIYKKYQKFNSKINHLVNKWANEPNRKLAKKEMKRTKNLWKGVQHLSDQGRTNLNRFEIPFYHSQSGCHQEP